MLLSSDHAEHCEAHTRAGGPRRVARRLVGRGASALELEGVVHEGELGRLVRGLHPQTHERLLRSHRRRG